MLLYVVIAVVVIAFVIALLTTASRGGGKAGRGDEVDRFSKAREMTTSWSQGAPSGPVKRARSKGGEEPRGGATAT